MLTLSANLVIWMTLVTEESLHQTTSPDFLGNSTKTSRRSMFIIKGESSSWNSSE